MVGMTSICVVGTGEEDNYENIKALFGHRTTSQEIHDLQLSHQKLQSQKKKERLRANEAARQLRQTHKLPPLDHMFEKNHGLKFKQFKLNAQASHISGGAHAEAPIVPAIRMPAMSMPHQTYQPKKLLIDEDYDFAHTFLKNTTMDQVRARIDKSTLNIPSKSKPRIPFLQALERF